jgi:hypothetical protein
MTTSLVCGFAYFGFVVAAGIASLCYPSPWGSRCIRTEYALSLCASSPSQGCLHISPTPKREMGVDEQ